ncbi:hypothetical protein GWI33_000734 [Rhynchophorus ferrugineus]|uniref:Uncharacterized protein n=1 Tax=Rhynchophorus ferrugineus TaxID=354439 RepID=A0A834HLT5_RHYFE|nr:hypothetical protein GWI33_000734 [Rhynchophorus ferrugineus]
MTNCPQIGDSAQIGNAVPGLLKDNNDKSINNIPIPQSLRTEWKAIRYYCQINPKKKKEKKSRLSSNSGNRATISNEPEERARREKMPGYNGVTSHLTKNNSIEIKENPGPSWD